MVVPDEVALKLYGFHVGVIQVTDDARVAIIGEEGKLFCDVYLVHGINLTDASISIQPLVLIGKWDNGMLRW